MKPYSCIHHGVLDEKDTFLKKKKDRPKPHRECRFCSRERGLKFYHEKGRRPYDKIKCKKYSENLTKGYLARVFVKHSKTLKSKDVPDHILDLYKIHIKIIRQINKVLKNG